MHIKIASNFFDIEPSASLSSDAQILYLKWLLYQEGKRTFIVDDWQWIAIEGLLIHNRIGRRLWKRSIAAVTELVNSKLIYSFPVKHGDFNQILVLHNPDSIRLNRLRMIKGGKL